MKKNVLSLALLGILSSACTSMMYGNNVAPVNNQNTLYAPEREGAVYDRQQVSYNAQTPASSSSAYAPSYGNTQTVSSQVEDYAQQSYSPYTTPSALDAQERVRPAVERELRTADDGWDIQGTEELAEEVPTVRPPQREEVAAAANTQIAEQAPVAAVREEAQSVNNAPRENNSVSGNAVNSLLQRANSELGRGNLDGAAAYLEDAHRIDSRNANILYDIANIRYHQQRYREAESAAARAANIAGTGAVAKKSWSLIANARKALGDNQGAIAAAEKAASF